MLKTYRNPVYQYQKSRDQTAANIAHHPLVVVGAGPVGLAAGLDAGTHGIDALILDESNTVSVGSRAVCYAKRSLEILDRYGCAQRMVAKGVTWKVGKIFFRDELIRKFDLLPEPGHQQPAFINLQQYYLEQYMVDRLSQFDTVALRWKNRLANVENQADGSVLLTIETPDGPYQITCDWLLVADGANSTVRDLMGLKSEGQIFQDRFLIVDVVMKESAPPERWFSFDPSYHRGWSTLLHRQADDVYRLDFQLGWDADPEVEKRPENIIPRVKAMLGEGVDFELEWASVYTFTCRRMETFRHGRMLYVGDAAHQVSPFGARGANSGFQDIDNLIWKLKRVIDKTAPEELLDSYCLERERAADENIMNSTRSTDFITPKSGVSKCFRDAVLELACDYQFAQALTNSGRLSDPSFLLTSPLNTPDKDHFAGKMLPGAVADDAPMDEVIMGKIAKRVWLLSYLGTRFNVLLFVDRVTDVACAEMAKLTEQTLGTNDLSPVMILLHAPTPADTIQVDDFNLPILFDCEGLAAQRFDAQPGTTYLIRPDQHVVARWKAFDTNNVQQSLRKAIGLT